jgi:hypothetical protein
MLSGIEIFNPNRELTPIGNLNRRWTQIYADKDALNICGHLFVYIRVHSRLTFIRVNLRPSAVGV